MGNGEDEYRVEHDTMGDVKVPKAALWRAQTQRAVENFPISGRPLEPEHIRALGLIKAAAARVNGELGVLEPDVAKAVEDAARQVADGRHDAEFPIDVFQTGSGTSSNMNANEVVASLAAKTLDRPVHPNDQVNASQSSNDDFPTSIHVAATAALTRDLLPALDHLASALEAKAAEFDSVVKAGRTHLMDATPVTLGQEFGGYATQVRIGMERLESTLPRLAELPLGGTAVGTGINAPPGFASRVIAILAEETGLPLTEARNHFEAQGSRDSLVEASGQLRTVAVGLFKICTDLRWMGSGPRAGLGRDPTAGSAAGLEHHAGEGQPGPARGDVHGLRPGRGQRRHDRVRRRRRKLRAQCDDAGHGGQPVGVHSASEQLCAATRRPVHHRDRGRRGALPRARGVVALDRDATEPRDRLRECRSRREAGGEGAPHDS